jgi:signal peptidase I
MKLAVPRLRKAKISPRLAEAIALVVVVVLIAALPLFAGTRSYPLTVVEGNSMEPNLHNGDLVYYTGGGKISKGTVIVFAQDNSGNPLLSGLTEPIVIHRVVAIVVDADGLMYYVTKGDNNDFNDSRVRFDRVLGVEMLVVPRVGLAFLFLKSPQGLIAVVGLIVVFYLSLYQTKAWKDKKKAAFMGQLAQRTLNGEVPEDLYRKFELATQNIEHVDPEKIEDASGRALASWLKSSLEGTFKIITVRCEGCQNRSVVFEGQKQMMLACVGQDGKHLGRIVAYAKGKDEPTVTCGYCYNVANDSAV